METRFRSLSDLASLIPEGEKSAEPSPASSSQHDGKGKSLRMAIERKGRKGKTVTIITGFQHNPQTMELIARLLKQACGCGGTVDGMDIEIQGDQRAKAGAALREMNYAVKG
jgi:translation initiation factor 1